MYNQGNIDWLKGVYLFLAKTVLKVLDQFGMHMQSSYSVLVLISTGTRKLGLTGQYS